MSDAARAPTPAAGVNYHEGDPVSLSKPQSGVAIGAGVAAVITAGGLGLAACQPMTGVLTLDARLHTLALCLLGPAFALVVCIGRLANHRFDTPADLDGSGLTVGTPRAKLLQALLQNTLEQVMLATLVYVACTLLGSPRILSMMSVGSAMFLAGRALFLWGYDRGAPSRALGFGLTFYPTVVLLACAGGFAIARIGS